MYHKILKTPSFHALLMHFDQELAEKERDDPCLNCGGPLHQANYPRSPLGLPVSCREHYETRQSNCCGVCRKRATPPSVRFFGRYRFPASIMILISAFMSRGSQRRYHVVKRYFGINISFRTGSIPVFDKSSDCLIFYAASL
jgi:predicted amidophosphoribosyltransferase